jgi:DNA repair protein RecN (Recombination protein N)
MLETLRIQNYALIERVELDFRPGLSVLTGETGAGKSILIGALNLVLGARASSESVRQGAAKAQIDAIFRLASPPRGLRDLLKEHDLTLEDGELFLSRTITSDGRSRAYACGTMIPVAVLAAIGDELVDLHGQHEHQSLLRPDLQLDLLDGFAGQEAAVDTLGETVAALREAARELAELESGDRERERRLEFLRFEVAEIDAAGLTPGEEEETRARHNLIAHAERVVQLAGEVFTSLYEGEGAAAVDTIDAALTALGEMAEIDPSFKVQEGQLQEARLAVEDVSREIQAFADRIEFDAEELERLNQRLALIGDLKRKYGDSIGAVLAYRDKAREELDHYDRRDERIGELRQRHDRLLKEAMALAGAVSKARAAAARKLDKQVTAGIQELGMKGGVFETRVEQGDLTARGTDRVEFLLAANAGEKPRPLRQVASGGELSRVMLALKTVSAKADRIPTLVFDEIDAGVGGAVAAKVAERLAQVARAHQTLCITHLPQIASIADHHYTVSKAEQKGRTVSAVRPVTGDERVAELARLLDGSVSPVSLEHARALLGAAP